ncbi:MULTISPECIES: FAD/NAD(P)-binding protein [unclassified Streptomyces]|uniref:FAD/NAD(P)-binding protein n=1 Tax=unclassified Streptomyces TaxID=2593676 RepID=UPI002DD9D972|nr:FAD/NAD(P)-binding protein [Streptomyces sp. NBC_01750]WSB04416.1 FAD/NAD(P)-binding protein [Streptomyces sp. NBC_01794]WSD31303.1 FAD/NAD(P)-binding protein [Streptomyces sp. NBC_01750]
MTMVPLAYRLVDRRRETADTVTVDLEPTGEALHTFAPGQFAMVYAFGVGEIPVSVSRMTGERLTHTIRAVGAVSRALCDLPTGASVGVRGPFGTGWNAQAARGHDLLVLGGGIGLAPLRPLIHAVLSEPHAYGHVNVLAGARTPDDLLYQDEFPDWRHPFCGVTVDRPTGDWTARVGVVTSLIDEAHFSPRHTTAFVCGPEVMIRATARALVHRGVRADRIRVSLERNMRCATGHCGHCQLGPLLLCRDGPVVTHDVAEPLLAVREL